MGRMDELIWKVADDLEDGRVPLSHEFLVDNEVTSTESQDLMTNLALILHGYVLATQEDRAPIQLLGAMYEQPEMGQMAVLHHKKEQALKKLR